MKKNLFVVVLCLLMAFIAVSCGEPGAESGVEPDVKSDLLTFYDVDADNTAEGAGPDGLTSKSLGWRYLQAASSDITATTWGNSGSFSTGTEIGTGYFNTKKIYATTPEGSSNMATAVWNQTIDGETGWFIPSIKELELLYKELKKSNQLDSFTSDNYWSSSESSTNDNYACAQKFNEDGQIEGARSNQINVRPVRYLTASKEVYIPVSSLVGNEVGPGGGYIFYDVDADNDKTENDGLTSATLGWRYIQAATSDVSATWGPAGKLATGTVIGTGYSNTKKIYAATATGSSNMATAVWNQTIDDGTGWFIPSKDELNLMYKQLKTNNLDLADCTWWSSSESSTNDNYACAQEFNEGGQIEGARSNQINVRPVRYLTASKEVYVPTGFIVGETALNSGYIFYDVDEDNTADGPGADGLMSSECGWRYLQAATNIKAIQNKAWGPSESIATGTEIGTGYANTKKLYEAGSSNETYMATSVWNQTIDDGTGWFIPSKAELEVLQLNLKNVIALPNFVYWSSSENATDSTKGHALQLKGGSPADPSKTYVNDTRVCPVRYLTASGEVYIPTT